MVIKVNPRLREFASFLSLTIRASSLNLGSNFLINQVKVNSDMFKMCPVSNCMILKNDVDPTQDTEVGTIPIPGIKKLHNFTKFWNCKRINIPH